MGSPITSDEFEAALSHASVGVWIWDLTAGSVRMSDETHRMLGYGPDVFDGSMTGYLARVHPEDIDEVRRSLEATIAERTAQLRLEHRLRRGDGQYVWLESRCGLTFDAAGEPAQLQGVVVDVTERKQSEERLRQSEERYRLFTELASDYVYEVDPSKPQLAPTVVAGSFERTTGHTPQQVADVGGWVNVIHPEDRAGAGAVLQGLALGRPVIGEYRILDGWGGVRWLRDRIRPQLDEAGKLVRLHGGVTDITEQRNLEERLARAQKLDAMARLAGSVAHDVNNLLLVLYGTLDELRDDAAAQRPPEPDTLDAIHSSIERTEELTRSLLAFGHKQVTVKSAGGLAELVSASVPLLRKAATERVRVRTELPGEDVIVAFDPGQVQLALINLCVNARDAMPDGGDIVVTVRRSEFSQDDPARPAELGAGVWGCIEVRDTGAGIEPEVLSQVFEPFFTTKPRGVGTGLGLAMVYGVAKQLNGAVTVESKVGEGSVFRLYLPLAQAEVQRTAASQFKTSVGGTEAILLVEDEDSARRVLSHP